MDVMRPRPWCLLAVLLCVGCSRPQQPSSSVPRTDHVLESREGLASYVAAALDGKKTASGARVRQQRTRRCTSHLPIRHSCSRDQRGQRKDCGGPHCRSRARAIRTRTGSDHRSLEGGRRRTGSPRPRQNERAGRCTAMGRAACRRTLEHLLFATSSRAFTQTARAALRAQAAGTLHRRQLRGRPHRGAVPQELDRDAFVERLQRAADARVRVASRSH